MQEQAKEERQSGVALIGNSLFGYGSVPGLRRSVPPVTDGERERESEEREGDGVWRRTLERTAEKACRTLS